MSLAPSYSLSRSVFLKNDCYMKCWNFSKSITLATHCCYFSRLFLFETNDVNLRVFIKCLRRQWKCDRHSVTHSIRHSHALTKKIVCRFEFMNYEFVVIISSHLISSSIIDLELLVSRTMQMQIINRSTNRLNLNEILIFRLRGRTHTYCVQVHPTLDANNERKKNSLTIRSNAIREPCLWNGVIKVAFHFVECCAKRSLLFLQFHIFFQRL